MAFEPAWPPKMVGQLSTDVEPKDGTVWVSDSYKFPATFRLKTASDIDAVFQAGQKIAANNFVVLVNTNKLNHPRLGTMIAKRKVKHAVDRNRIKRIIRESFRLQQHDLKNYDIIVLATKDIDKLPNEQLQQCLAKIWPKLAKSLNT